MERVGKGITRRRFLSAAATIAGLAGVNLLAACAKPATPAPATQAPPAAAPTLAPTSAPAAAPTQAPPTQAPQAAPTAVPPTEAPPVELDAGYMRAPEGNVKRGGTVRCSNHISISHFDPHQGGAGGWSQNLLYNNLIRYDLTDGLRTIIPDLARAWEISADGLAITFFLRENVQFHDGTPFNADDVVANFTRIALPPEGFASSLKGLFVGITAIDKVDDYTVKFTLDQPRPYIVESFTHPSAVLLSKKELDANNNDMRSVMGVGTGAFKLKEYREKEVLIFEKNPNYWDPELPYVDQIELQHHPEWSDRGTAVFTGQSDMTLNTSVEMVAEARQRPEIVQTNPVPSLGQYSFRYNCEHEPFTDPRVRQAINLAVSHQALIAAYGRYEGVRLSRWFTRASSYATPTEELEKLPGYREDKTEDIAEAKRLMAEAGFPDGFAGVDLVSGSDTSHSQVLAPAIQEQLKTTLNIDATIRVIDRATISQEMRDGNFDLMIVGTTFAITVDPASVLNNYYKTGSSQNFCRYSNAKVDELADQISVELDETKRRQLAAEVQDVLDEDPPWFTVGWTDHNPVWRNEVKGIALDKRVMSELGRIETVWLDK